MRNLWLLSRDGSGHDRPLSRATSWAHSTRSSSSGGHLPGQWRRQSMYNPSSCCTVSHLSTESGVGVSIKGVDVGASMLVNEAVVGVGEESGMGTAGVAIVSVGDGAAWRSRKARAVHPTPHATAPNRRTAPNSRTIWDLEFGIWNLGLATTPSPPRSLRYCPPHRPGWLPRPGHRKPSAGCVHLRWCAGFRHPAPSPTAHPSITLTRHRLAVAV